MTKRTQKNHKSTANTRNNPTHSHEQEEQPKRRFDLNQCAGLTKLCYWLLRIAHEQDWF